MSTQENVQLVQHAYANFAQGNIPAILEALTEDVDWFIPGPVKQIPFAGRRQGPNQVGEFFKLLAELQSAGSFEPREFIAEGEKVVALGYQRWTVKATGQSYEDEWAHVFTIRDGKISYFREYHDTQAEVAAHQPSIA